MGVPEFTGLRPGEKLYEELFNDRENFSLTRHERIFIAPDTVVEETRIDEELQLLNRYFCGQNREIN